MWFCMKMTLTLKISVAWKYCEDLTEMNSQYHNVTSGFATTFERFALNGKNIVKWSVNHKKRDILFLTITLANLHQFA